MDIYVLVCRIIDSGGAAVLDGNNWTARSDPFEHIFSCGDVDHPMWYNVTSRTPTPNTNNTARSIVSSQFNDDRGVTRWRVVVVPIDCASRCNQGLVWPLCDLHNNVRNFFSHTQCAPEHSRAYIEHMRHALALVVFVAYQHQLLTKLSS